MNQPISGHPEPGRAASMPTAAGGRQGPHRPGDRSPAALPADAPLPGRGGSRPTAQPGAPEPQSQACQAHRTALHRTSPLAPLWSASPRRRDLGLPTVAALKGTVPQEPVPLTATNPSRQRLLRGPLPRTLARESDAGPSGCGRGALLAGPRARLAPLPAISSWTPAPGFPILGGGGLGHILAFQDGQGPDVWQRELGETWSHR